MRHRITGLTLVELMVAIAVLGVIATFTVPALGAMMSRNRVSAYVNDVNALAKRARSEAIRRREDVVVCGSLDLAGCSDDGWGRSLLVFVDENGDGEAGAGEEVLARVGPLAQDSLEIRSFDSAVYGPGGILRAAGTLRLDVCSESFGRRRSMSVLFLVGGKTVGIENPEGFTCA